MAAPLRRDEMVRYSEPGCTCPHLYFNAGSEKWEVLNPDWPLDNPACPHHGPDTTITFRPEVRGA